MTVRRKKKIFKQRGTRTCGAGTKKRRGSGNRGGYGMAGSGKRADQKKPSIINEFGNTYFGKHGFVRQTTVHYKAININFLDRKIDSLAKKGKADLKSNAYTIDLDKIGIGKLLASGSTSKKMHITVDMASKNAIEKIKKAGGDVITKTLIAKEKPAPSKKEEKPAKKA